MSGFDDLRRHHTENVTLSTARFAETVSVVFPGGATREIAASCRRTTTYEQDDENGAAKAIDTLIVSVSKGPIGGIEQPVDGYKLYRAPTVDHDRRPYRFSGEIEEEGHFNWQLRFTRTLLQREAGR